MSRTAYLAQGVAAGALFGTASIFIRFIPRLDALSLGFYRLLLAALFMAFINAVVFRRLWFSEFRGYSRRIALLGILIGLHFVFFISAVKDTTILNATVLVNTTPALATAISIVAYRVKPSPVGVAGLLVTFVGVLLITLAEATLSPGKLIGDIEAILAAFFWAIYLTMGKRIRAAGNVLLLMTPIYMYAAVLMGIARLTIKGLIEVPLPLELPALLGLALLPTVLGHTLHFSSLRHLTPFQTSTLALLEPVVASVLAAAIFLELPRPLFYVGASITLAGIYLVLRG